MAYTATIYKVFITSPDDLPNERFLLENSILQWNQTHGESKKALLFPYYCDNVEKFNHSDFDMIFGTYWTKLKDDIENDFQDKILDFINEGNPAKFYFSNKDIPKSMLDINKWSNLEKFKTSLLSLGLVREFDNEDDLLKQMENQITKTVESLEIMNKMFEEAKDDPYSLEKLNLKKKSGFFNYMGTIEDTASELVHTIGDFIMETSDFALKLEEQFQKEIGKNNSFGALSLDAGRLFTQFTKDIEHTMRNYEYIWAEFSNIFTSFTNNVSFLEGDYLIEMKDLIEHLTIGLESAKNSLVPFSGNFKNFSGSLDLNVSARMLSTKLANFSQNLDKSIAELNIFSEKMSF